MVNYCVAVGCKNRAKKGSGISFFLFPHKDPQRLNQWVHAIRRKDWKPSAHSCICSDHFEEKCFVVRPGCEGRKLTQIAVPTIFSSVSNLLPETNECRQVKVSSKKGIYSSSRIYP